MQTLLQMSTDVLTGDEVKRSAIIELLAASSSFLEVLPFESAAGGAYCYPDGRPQELLKIAGADVDVAMADAPDGGRSKHEAIQVRKLSRRTTRMLIKGLTDNDPREPNGLLVRADHVIHGSVTQASLKTALEHVPRATHILVAENTSLPVDSLEVSVDDYGRHLLLYKVDTGRSAPTLLPLLKTGLNEIGDPILAKGAFVVRLGADGVRGVQNGVPAVDDLGPVLWQFADGKWVEGPISEATTLRTRIEWLVNLAHEPDSICYITG